MLSMNLSALLVIQPEMFVFFIVSVVVSFIYVLFFRIFFGIFNDILISALNIVNCPGIFCC